jgi:hypothetical protein
MFTTQIEQLHREIATQVFRQRRMQMEAHNANTNLIQPYFQEGDYVLRAVSPLRQHVDSCAAEAR